MSFQPTWKAEVLSGPPMIAPARSFVYPVPVPGEEDAMARGAMYLQVIPRTGGSFLALCALGFSSGSVASGVFAMPSPDEMCAVAGGYAYLVDTTNPSDVTQVGLRPVVSVLPAADAVVFQGFHSLVVRGKADTLWETPRLSWEGITELRIEGNVVHGTGWDMRSDEEVPFTVDLETRTCKGGGYRL